MPAKRKSQTLANTASKKVKTEESPCFFPLGVSEMLKEIGKHLNGKDLLNYKATCKSTKEATKDRILTFYVTLENIKETCSRPGIHIIKFTRFEERTRNIFNQLTEYPLVTDLTIDYAGLKTVIPNSSIFAEKFPNLVALRIIRCANIVELTIPAKMEKLSTLEIYTSNCIQLSLWKAIKNVKLCSMERHTPGYANIRINLYKDDIRESALAIKCVAQEKVIDVSRTEDSIVITSCKDFVIDPRLLQ